MRTLYLATLIGAIIGLTIHLIWHFQTGISLFKFASHIFRGTAYTIIGAIIGMTIGFFIEKKPK